MVGEPEGAAPRAAPSIGPPGLAGGPDAREQAVRLVLDAGGEDERLLRADGAVAEAQAPQALVDDGVAARIAEGAEQLAGLEVVGVDPAVAEVAHEQRMAELAEVTGRAHQAPRGVQLVAADQAADEPALQRVDVDEALAGARLLLVRGRVDLGVGDEQLLADDLDVERRVAVRELVVHERAGRGGWHPGAV